MQSQFYAGTNPEGSLRIYEPAGQPISTTFFSSERQVGALPKPKPYLRQESIIDRLGNREEGQEGQEGQEGREGSGESGRLEPKPTSIEFLVVEGEERASHFQPLRIEDIFANRPALFSQEINSSLLRPVGEPPEGRLEERSRNSSSHILLPSFPSREHMPDSPERPNLHRPFLRKKTSSARCSEALPNKSASDHSFELARLESALRHLKDYNGELLAVLRGLQALEEDEGNAEWRAMGRRQVELLKLMVEKAIIAKEDR